MQGRDEKLEFRKAFAKLEFQQCSEQHIHTVSEDKSNFKQGTWRSLARIAVEEGGGKPGCAAAANYGMACLQLGQPWWEWDTYTQQVKFNYVERGFWDSFKQSWTKTRFETKRLKHPIF